MPGPYGIQLRFEPQLQQAAGVDDVFRLVVTAHHARNMPNEVFVYALRPRHPADAGPTAEFSHVASPTELETYSTAPLDDTLPAFFRAATIDFLCDTRQQAIDIEMQLQDRAARLVLAMEASDTLGAATETSFGTPADP